MTLTKENKLRQIIRQCGSIVIAYSGGVDSTLVAKVAHQELGEKALMVIADSPSLARQELQQALALAKQHNFSVRIVNTDEIDNLNYRSNSGDRCYFCKQTLYRHLEQVRIEMQFNYLANGDHIDDKSVHRPGQQAGEEKAVRSVLAEAGFTKEEVRALAKKLELPNHDKPASPCLSSRILTGTEVTPKKLLQVEKAESFLKSNYKIRDLRVRHRGEKAHIETHTEYFPLVNKNRQEINDYFYEVGFKEWSLTLMRVPLEKNISKSQ